MATTKRIPEEQIEQARHADVLALAQRCTTLKRMSVGEYAGPCPRCGGEDRFHATAEWFICRQCHPKRGDAIELVSWLQPGLSFSGAVAQLTGGALPMPPVPAPTRQPKHQNTQQPADWQRKNEAQVLASHNLLWTAEGEPGQQYLLSRGLEPQTWMTYRVGFRPDAPLPGTKGQQRAPAIVLPWIVANKLVAVRYRFLESQGGHKLTAAPGSQFAGQLFGMQALPEWAMQPAPDGYRTPERHCTLLIVEGEINAMSAWQVAGETRLHVLSIGSEGAQLAPETVQYARRYGLVVVGADEVKVAQRLMAAIPGAVGIRSPGGKDANDLLQVGQLGGFLAKLRANNAKSPAELEALLWALYDAASLPLGIDAGTAKVLQDLAAILGKSVELCEPEPKR